VASELVDVRVDRLVLSPAHGRRISPGPGTNQAPHEARIQRTRWQTCSPKPHDDPGRPAEPPTGRDHHPQAGDGTTINAHVGASTLDLERMVDFDGLLREKGHEVTSSNRGRAHIGRSAGNRGAASRLDVEGARLPEGLLNTPVVEHAARSAASCVEGSKDTRCRRECSETPGWRSQRSDSAVVASRTATAPAALLPLPPRRPLAEERRDPLLRVL
jgi:hypothetical protein